MLNNYLKVAFRNIARNKLYASVSVLGLALGLSVSILAIHYLTYEFSFDKWPGAGRIYEVVDVQSIGGRVTRQGSTPPGLSSALREKVPGIEASTGFMITTLPVRRHGSGVLSVKFCMIDSGFRHIFPMHFIEGSARTSLADPNSVVITRSLAGKVFGSGNPMGKTLTIDGHGRLVTGLIDDLPRTTSFSFEGLLSNRDRDFHPFSSTLNWRMFASILTFVKISGPADVKLVSARLPGFVKATGGYPGFDGLELLPLRKVHFATYLSPLLLTYEPRYLFIFSAVALLVLAVSVSNYVGINITVFSRRTREIGVRKVTGATTRDLIVQFLAENILLTAIAFGISVCFAELSFHWFDSMLGLHDLSSLSILNAGAILLLLSVLFFDVVLSIYATRIFASARINSLVKGETDRYNVKKWVRKVLVAGQFVIAVFLIICTIVVITQMDFISRKNLGFNKHNLLLVDNVGTQGRAEVLKTDLLENPDVLDVTEARWLLTTGAYVGVSLYFDNGRKLLNMHFVQVDQNFVPTLGLKLVKGRNFNPSMPSDSGAAIVNEQTLRELNISHPLRDSLRFNGKAFKVIGVVKDFNYSSLRNHVEPFLFEFASADPPSLAVRIRRGKTNSVLSFLRENWKKVNPDKNLNYSFLDKDLNKFYVSDDRMLDALVSGSLVAILISLMGIFALSSFLVEAKTKEIAVRKVLGSSVAGVIGLLSVDFLRLVVVSNIIAWPAAYLVTRSWLQGFVYRTGMNLAVFPMVGLTMLFLAFSSVVLRALKAARANPVESLRYE